ncbi:DedA family protein [Patescibacteria group bacterium]|nr:DedA family protein [Patescibacteria group bacterium]
MELSPYLLHLVETYGYLAVFLGSLFEGDALLLVASFLAYLGKLDLPIVMLAAFFGTWLSDVIWFMLGRYSHNTWLARSEFLNSLSNRSADIVGKRPRLMAVSMRFMYGLRMVIPFSLGKTPMSTSSFLVYNAIGVWIWVFVFTALGYFFATIAETMFGRMKHLEIILPIIIVTTLLLFIYASHIIEYALKIYPKREPK